MIRGVTRRTLLRGGAGLVGASALASGCVAPPRELREPPNVLLITADDLGWLDVSSYGNAQVATPGIDRLAAEGVAFDRAFDVSSSCSPSRASFITGQYPHTHGVLGLTHVRPEHSLPPGRATLPRLLQDAGWSTALHGKWHVAPFDPVQDHGYDVLLNEIALPTFVINRVDDTVAFIEDSLARGSGRFSVEVNFMQTHRNLVGDFAMAEGFEVDPASIEVPAYWNLPDWPEIREEVARYFSQLRKMDALVGELLAALDRFGVAESTLVAFASDNGPPFPGNKTTLYDRGTGTPLLFRWPGVLPEGRRVSSLVSTIDLMPTILEACGVAIPGEVQGTSLLALAAGRDEGRAESARTAVFSEMNFHRDHIPMRAVRTERFKYVRNYSDRPVGLDDVEDEAWAQRLVELPDQPWTRPRVPEELYDLEEDPNERQNLVGASDAAPVLDDLRALLDRHMSDTADPLLGAPFEQTQ